MPSQDFPRHRDRAIANDDTDRQNRPTLAQSRGIQHQHQLPVLISPQTHDPAQQRGEAGDYIQVSALFPAFVLSIQIPLAQALKHRLFLLVQHRRDETH